MTDSPRYRDVLAASLRGEFDRAKALGDDLGEVTWDESGLLLGATFYLLTERRFASDNGKDAVADFVKECGEAFEDTDMAFQPLVWEGLVRAVLGEDELAADIAAEDAMPAQMGLSYRMVKDLGLGNTDIDQLMGEAEALAAEWAKM